MTKREKANIFYRRRLRFRIFRRDRFTCRYCGRTITDGVQLTLDHILPKSQGGEHTSDNLITACLDCNQGKLDDVLTEWEVRDLKRESEYLRGQDSLIITV